MTAVPGTAATVTRAARLLDADLSDFGTREDVSEKERLASFLLQLGVADEPRNAREIVTGVLTTEPEPLDGLCTLASDMVQVRGGIPEFRDPVLWHLVGRCLDTDLVVAACFAHPRRPTELFRNRVTVLSWPSVLGSSNFLLESILTEAITETHTHLGGALPGSFHWIAMMSGFAHLYRLMEWSKKDRELWPRSVLDAWERRRRLMRRLLGVPRHLAKHHATVWPNWSSPWEAPEEAFVDPILEHLLPEPSERVGYNPALGERYLLWEALALWLRNKLAPEDQRDLVAYLRVRNSFIRELIHKPGLRGLDRFQATFRRQDLLFADHVGGNRIRARRRRRARKAALRLERFRVRHALRYQFSDPTDAPWARDHGAGLNRTSIPSTPWRPQRQIEMRVSPILNSLQIRVIWAYLQGVGDFLRNDLDAPPLRVGFVMHMLRGNDLRNVRDKAEWQMRGLMQVLRFVPQFRPFIVGVDAAGGEMSTAPRELRRAFQKIRAEVEDQLPKPGFAPVHLGRTCHAGEDFRDLLTGLRYVDETVHLLELQPGERIGHGLALAFEPETWYGRRRRTYPMLGDHVLDLIWGLWLARQTDPELGFTADTDLEHQIRVRLERILGHKPEARDRIHELAGAFYDHKRFPHEADLLDFLDIPNERRDTPFETRLDPTYVEIVTQLRQRVLRRVEQAEVVLEVCPTSNLVISGLTSYGELPYRNLNRFHLSDDSDDGYTPHIFFSINSDDPGMFQTTVGNEYRLLGQAMVEAGERRRSVVRWLDEARKIGLASTFIPPWSPPTREEILAALERLELFSRHTPGATRWTEPPRR